MSKFDKLVIGGDPAGSFAYLYYKVLGDNHCFVNCYLEACRKRYQNETNRLIRSHIARKARLDFANFLIAESKKDTIKICSRLNIINPTIMCKFFCQSNGDSSFTALKSITAIYTTDSENNDDEIYGMILILELMMQDDMSPLTYETIKTLYERDPRINAAIANAKSERSKTINFESYGIDKFPINIGYYKLAFAVPIHYSIIIDTINYLISPTEFLNHNESSLLASFIDINAVSFALGTGYSNVLRLTENKPGVPELLMINLSSIHWNLISFKAGESEQLLVMDVPQTTKVSLFNRLKTLYEQRMLTF